MIWLTTLTVQNCHPHLILRELLFSYLQKGNILSSLNIWNFLMVSTAHDFQTHRVCTARQPGVASALEYRYTYILLTNLTSFDLVVIVKRTTDINFLWIPIKEDSPNFNLSHSRWFVWLSFKLLPPSPGKHSQQILV